MRRLIDAAAYIRTIRLRTIVRSFISACAYSDATFGDKIESAATVTKAISIETCHETLNIPTSLKSE
ncbi:hypothetical protein GCM10017044_20390 [Kordiimonas sediminis]|uniref:Uncharacterized protein n=1 Tax=Kordiimonas sediminis TaxID=1735581 RepID=A0A919E733_9PROT|nr:hypothetical protein GCM10017044_20390 [Kordiimonas sediminis]